MSAISVEDLQSFRTWLLDRGRSEGTARVYLLNLRRCMEHPRGLTARLVGTDLAPKTMRTNLAALASWANFREDAALQKRLKEIRLPPAQRITTKLPMESDEWERLIGCVRSNPSLSDPMRASLLIICRRGMRCSDVLRLRRTDVVSALRTGRLIGETKGRKRIEYSAAPIREALETLADIPGWHDVTDLLVPTSKRAGYARRESAVKKLERALRRCAKGARVTGVHPHRLRRTYATHYVQRLKNDPRALLKLQEHMGWSAMSTAAQYVDAVQREELDAIGDEMIAELDANPSSPPRKPRKPA